MSTAPTTTGKFTSEIHIGLLVLVLILLSLDVLSNFYLNRLRLNLREEASARFTVQALTVARTLATQQFDLIPSSALTPIREQHGLNGIALIIPPDSAHPFSPSMVRSSSFSEKPDLDGISALISEPLGTVTQGPANSFYFLTQLRQHGRPILLLLSSENRTLAFLDHASDVIFYTGGIAMLLCLVLYFTVYRLIIKPFRVLRLAAQKAGRGGDLTDGNIDAVIARYQQIIDELQEKEQELLGLKDLAERRAASVQGFNEYLVSSMPVGLISCNPYGNLVSLNEIGAQILGANPADLAGKPVLDTFGLDTEELQILQRALAGEAEVTWRETELTTANGQKKQIGYTASRVHDESGAILGSCILFSDITELQGLRSELELNRRQASLGEMAAGLAHQLRNSLGAIVGYGRLLKRSQTNQTEQTTHADTLIDEASQANQLITRFLELSRQLEVHPESVNVRSCLESVVTSLGMRAEYQDRSISIDCESNVTAKFDPLLMKQVLTNLLENALQAKSAEPTQVVIFAESTAEALRITVTDNGPGIPPHVREKLFTPFYSSRPDGTGLGLALARKIVELHGGRLSIESASEQGTVCTISLPQSAHTPPAYGPAAHSAR